MSASEGRKVLADGKPGRPKKSTLEEKEQAAREQGLSYGEFMASLQKKDVKIEKNDDIERKTTRDRIKIPARSLHLHHAAIKDIQEEIDVHMNTIKEEQNIIDQHEECIKTHYEAVVILKAELKAEEDFLKAFED